MSRSPRLTSSLTLLAAVFALGCDKQPAAPAGAEPNAATAPAAKAKPLQVPRDPNNIVSIAVASKDHTTLVAAMQAADYVASVANPGPLTVFAPTNAAFEKLPAGTVETLLKPENLDALKNVIKYHATTSTYMPTDLKDGQVLAMANGQKVTIHVADGKLRVNDANVIASVRASNGAVHIIDAVLLPK